MGKLLLSMVAVASLSSTGEQRMANTMKLDPMPPVQGQSVTIKWTGPTPTTILIDWDPPAEPSSVYLASGEDTVTITVPSNASSVAMSVDEVVYVSSVVDS
jgi:hypothetical protein